MSLTAQQRAQWMLSYWQSMAMSSAQYAAWMVNENAGNVSAIAVAQKIAEAQRTMKLLVAECTSSPTTRLSAFAGNGLFEQALLLEDGRLTGVVLSAARAGRVDTFTLAALMAGDRNLRPPRQIMLDMIYDAGTAGIFAIKEPSGMTSWIKSVNAAGIACSGTIKGDPDAGPRAALLKILRDVAIPLELARSLKEAQTFEALIELLPGLTLPVDARRTLQALAASADGRITRQLAEANMGGLPLFPTGDGTQVMTLPADLAWWRRPGTWLVGAGGLITGGIAYGRARR